MMNLSFMSTLPGNNNFNWDKDPDEPAKKLMQQQVTLLYALMENKKYRGTLLNKNELILDNDKLQKILQYLTVLLDQLS